MHIYLEITQLENGDIVLREARDEAADEQIPIRGGTAVIGRSSEREPLVRISFSDEVRDMLGGELVEVAEAMIDAATDYLGGDDEAAGAEPPVVH